MRACFSQRDVPLFLSLANKYAPERDVALARKSLRIFATGFNQNYIYKDTVDAQLPAISNLLNTISTKLKEDAKCTFFDENQIVFGSLDSYVDALAKLTTFKSSREKPYSVSVNRYIAYDLFDIVSTLASCIDILKSREEKIVVKKEVKKPVLRDITAYPYIFLKQTPSEILSRKQKNPAIEAYRILKEGLSVDSINEVDYTQLHGCLETMLINGWGYYYKKIKLAYSAVEHNIRYTNILEKLELVGSNIINVSLIGRHNRQVASIDIRHNFDDEAHRNMMVDLQGFLGNMFCLFLAYNYLSQRIQKDAEPSEIGSGVVYTWTCGFCSKKFGNDKAVLPDHTITIQDTSGQKQRVSCPGKKHPPIEVGDSGLRIKAETEKSRYENAVLELKSLDNATSLMVIGKYSNRIFTPKDLSWKDRINKAKAEKQKVVDDLKAVYDQTAKVLSKWKPTPSNQIPVWTGSKKKIA